MTGTHPLKELSAEDRQRLATVETVRSVLAAKECQVWHISPEATVYEAIACMAAKSIGALPVISQEELVGIISERDYARKVILQGRSSRETLVREIMSPSPVVVSLDTTVEECLQIVNSRRVRHLPVVEAGRVTGMISIGDLVRTILASQAFTIRQLHTYIAEGYPA